MRINSYCCIDTSSSDMRGVLYDMLIILPKLLLKRKFIAYSVFFIGGISIGKQHTCISSLTFVHDSVRLLVCKSVFMCWP